MTQHDRTSSRKRGYTWQWDQRRTLYLQRKPLCVMCATQGRVTAANVVDHIQPHKGDMGLFWDEQNWQSLCKPCHDRHKQRQDRIGFDTRCDVTGWPIDPNHPANRK